MREFFLRTDNLKAVKRSALEELRRSWNMGQLVEFASDAYIICTRRGQCIRQVHCAERKEVWGGADRICFDRKSVRKIMDIPIIDFRETASTEKRLKCGQSRFRCLFSLF